MQIFLVFFGMMALVASHPADECKMSEMFANPQHMIMDKLGFMGCLDIKYSDEMMKIMHKCCMNVGSLLMKSFWDGELPESSDLKMALRKAMTCKYETFTDDGVITRNSIGRALEEANIQGTDSQLFTDIALDCTDNLPSNEIFAEHAVTYDHCLGMKMIEHCDSKGQPLKTMPLMMAILSLAKDNRQCDSVKINTEVEGTYMDCADEGMEQNIVINPPHLTGMPKLIHHAFVNLPVIQSLLCTGKKLNFLDDNYLPKFPEFTTYVEQQAGWDPQMRSEVIGHMNTCASKANEEENEYKRDMIFHCCLLPKFAMSCGMENELAKFMFPFTEDFFLNELISNIKELLEEKDHIKFIAKYLIDVVMHMMKMKMQM